MGSRFPCPLDLGIPARFFGPGFLSRRDLPARALGPCAAERQFGRVTVASQGTSAARHRELGATAAEAARHRELGATAAEAARHRDHCEHRGLWLCDWRKQPANVQAVRDIW
jgi:hypothetical protein